ncbi:MAG: 5-formyltetrahydrofolate cyclo-ligase [Verrucomicrobiales bacterium]|nr:5-formyltetrahydrofolate cyclo-ligase [Verrucomicrobiales bacterium]|tara:strand:+ start:11463 stop:12053 length:591 start_codon:yes stop_codon:yes gene_type:complete
MSSIAQEKQRVRMKAWDAVSQITHGERIANGSQIQDRLTGTAVWQNASAVLIFAPLPDEPDIAELCQKSINAGKTTCLPRYLPAKNNYEAAVIHDPARDLIPAKFGILEPSLDCEALPSMQLDLVLVPGVAFAPSGTRLGRGKGFYDRILGSVSAQKIGVAFDQQIVMNIPFEEHDQRVDAIVTPTRWIETMRRSA